MSKKKAVCVAGLYDGYFNRHPYTVRRKAIVLCCNNSGPRLTIREAAKVLKVSPAYVRKWVKYYETTGLFGYLDKRQSAILIICKKNPGIPISQIKVLMQNMGFDLTYSKLTKLLHNLKPILQNPSFTLGCEQEVLRCIRKLTVFQNNKLVRNNFLYETGYNEHAYARAPPTESIIQDHNYAMASESYSSGEEEELLEEANDLDDTSAIKTDFIDKAYALSTLHDNLSLKNTISRLNNNNEKLTFKLALLREQLFYACMDMKGPKSSLEDIISKLYKSEVLIKKLLNQAKTITDFVSKIHINKCCGRIQETIIRLYKLNPGISVGQVKCILEKVNIYLTPLQVKRYLDTLQYILRKPVNNTENELDDVSTNEVEVDYCISTLNSIIAPQEKRKNNLNGEYPKLTFEKIIELSSVNKSKTNGSTNKRERNDITINKTEKNIIENKEKEIKSIENSKTLEMKPTSSLINTTNSSNYQNKFDSLCSIASLYNHIEENRKSTGFESIDLNSDNQIIETYNELKERTHNFPLIHELHLPLEYSNSKSQKQTQDNQELESIKMVEDNNDISECINIPSDTSECSSNTDISQYMDDNEIMEYNHIPTDTSTCSSNTDTSQSIEDNDMNEFNNEAINASEWHINTDSSQHLVKNIEIIELDNIPTDTFVSTSIVQYIDDDNKIIELCNTPIATSKCSSKCSSNTDYSTNMEEDVIEINNEMNQFNNIITSTSELNSNVDTYGYKEENNEIIIINNTSSDAFTNSSNVQYIDDNFEVTEYNNISESTSKCNSDTDYIKCIEESMIEVKDEMIEFKKVATNTSELPTNTDISQPMEENNEIIELNNTSVETSISMSSVQYIDGNETAEHMNIPMATSTYNSDTDSICMEEDEMEIVDEKVEFNNVTTNSCESHSNTDTFQYMEENNDIIELNNTPSNTSTCNSRIECIDDNYKTIESNNITVPTSECNSDTDYVKCMSKDVIKIEDDIESNNARINSFHCISNTCTENNVPQEKSINGLQPIKSYNTVPDEEETQDMTVDFSEIKVESSNIQWSNKIKLPSYEDNKVNIETNILNGKVDTVKNISKKLRSEVTRTMTSLNNLSLAPCDKKYVNKNGIVESQKQYSNEIKLICTNTQNTNSIIKNDGKFVKNCVNNVCTVSDSSQIKQEPSNVNIINKKIVEDKVDRKKDISTNTYKVSPNNMLLSTKVLSTFKERKRKCSESEDEDESLESEFEPIEDSCYDEQTLRFYENCKIKIEETDYSKKMVMADIVNEDDDCIVIKYWPTKYF